MGIKERVTSSEPESTDPRIMTLKAIEFHYKIMAKQDPTSLYPTMIKSGVFEILRELIELEPSFTLSLHSEKEQGMLDGDPYMGFEYRPQGSYYTFQVSADPQIDTPFSFAENYHYAIRLNENQTLDRNILEDTVIQVLTVGRFPHQFAPRESPKPPQAKRL